MSIKRQAVVTAVYGDQINQLDHTFLSFAQNKFLELHAFIIGDRLPQKQFSEINYHLCKSDERFVRPFRDCQHQRFLFLDRLDVEHAMLVDGTDVLCLGKFTEIPELLRGASVGGCVEHSIGSRVMYGTASSNYMNDGVTFWHVPSSRQIRQEIFERGLSMFRTLWDDQESFNEVVNSQYEKLVILPCQYNYRANLNRKSRNWPTVTDLDGVKIYHNRSCIEEAKKILPVGLMPFLKPLPKDTAPPSKFQQFWRRKRHYIKPYE